VRITTRITLCAVVGATVVPLAPAAAVAAAPIDCPTVRPAAEVAAGDLGTGYTVSRGTVPEPFDVEVVDVLQDGIAPGLPLIVVEVDSPELDRVGGIWAGMSGSPVYVDGELIGAVAYGFSAGPSKLGGVTPATAMLEVPNRPAPPPPLGGPAPEVRLPTELRTLATTEHGVTAAAARSMQPLELPVRLSGPVGTKFDQAAAAFERAHPGTTVVRGAGSGAVADVPTSVGAGGNLAVSLSYGDLSAIGVGTATTVCDGVVTGFGHPMMFAGATRMGMHAASAVRVVDDPTLTPFKLANASAPVGTIDQDRLAAVAGRLGPLPVTTAITSSITTTDDGRTVTGRTDLVFEDIVLDAVLMHGWANFDTKAFDDPFFAGTSDVAWTISGIRADGSPFALERSDRHADPGDLSTASLIDVAVSAQVIHDNPFEQVRITGVDYQATAGSPYRSDRIVGDQVTVSVDGGDLEAVGSGLEVGPGAELVVRVPLQRYRGATRSVDVPLTVPDDVAGFGSLSVIGGGGGEQDPFECLFLPEECVGPGDASGLDALIRSIEDAPRGDDLVVTLQLFEGFEEPVIALEDDGGSTVVSSVVPVGEVVTGAADLPVVVLPPFEPGLTCPEDAELPFVDVVPGSTHADNVTCAAALGIAEGVSLSPPRFAPERTVTRAQIASLLARLLDVTGVPLPDAGTRFTDLGGSVHAENVERLAAAGIVRGRTTTTYAPGQPVTRGQLASLLAGTLRYATGEELAPSGPSPFPDVAGVHADNVTVAWELGLVLGRTDGTFHPDGSTRRDQAATVLVRTLDVLAAGG
jgi:hypothetical protein